MRMSRVAASEPVGRRRAGQSQGPRSLLLSLSSEAARQHRIPFMEAAGIAAAGRSVGRFVGEAAGVGRASVCRLELREDRTSHLVSFFLFFPFGGGLIVMI